MERKYDVLETFVEEQKDVPRRGEETTHFLLRSKKFPEFSKNESMSYERFLVFTFPFEIHLNDGDKIEFNRATIEYSEEVIPVRLLEYSEMGMYVRDGKQEGNFIKILEFKRRDLELLNLVKRSYTWDFGERKTPRLVSGIKSFSQCLNGF